MRRAVTKAVDATFAATASLLALAGIYGVITFIVVQRTREIGIRMALGARRQDIVSMVARHGMRIALFGLGAGLIASLVLTRVMASMIYDLNTTDPLTLLAVACYARPHSVRRVLPSRIQSLGDGSFICPRSRLIG